MHSAGEQGKNVFERVFRVYFLEIRSSGCNALTCFFVCFWRRFREICLCAFVLPHVFFVCFWTRFRQGGYPQMLPGAPK